MKQLRYLNFSGFEITSRDGYRVVIDPFLTGNTRTCCNGYEFFG